MGVFSELQNRLVIGIVRYDDGLPHLCGMSIGMYWDVIQETPEKWLKARVAP